MKSIGIARVMFGIGILAAAAASAQKPELTVAPAATPPVIDGVLSDPCWQKAPTNILNHLVGTGGVAAVSTRFFAAHDADWLYFGIRCEDEPGKKILATRRGRNNTGTTSDDSLEIFVDIAPGKEKHDYFHFMLGAGGAKRQQRVTGPVQNPAWEVSWPSAVTIADGGWQAEVALPLFIFGREKIGPLSFNLTRNKQTTPVQNITWTPLTGESRAAYYNPEAFGVLRGLTGLTITRRCAPLIERAYGVSLFRETTNGYAFDFRVTLANPGGAGGTGSVVVEDVETATGLTNRQVFAVQLLAEGQTNYVFEIPAPNPVDRRVRVALADEQARDEAWMDVAGTAVLQCLTAYPDLNYYCGEKNGKLTIGTVFSDSVFAQRKLRLEVRITGPDGRGFREETFAKIKNQGVIMEYDPSEWAPGTYPVAVALKDGQGTVLGTRQNVIRVEPPPPAGITVTKVDQERMSLLLNGKPFFPFGFLNIAGFNQVDVFNEKTETIEQADFPRRCAQAGFNILVDWRPPRSKTGRSRVKSGKAWTEEMDKLVAADIASNLQDYARAQAAGLYVSSINLSHISLHFNNEAVIRKDYDLVMAKLPGIIAAYRNVPNLALIQGRDEVSQEIFDEVLAHAAIMRKADPYHVIYATCRGIHPNLYEAYDIFGVHAYWGPDAGPNRLASWIQGGAQSGKVYRRPVFATPQGQRLTYRRELTPDERRCGIYLPLIQGAKGVFFFAHPEPYEIVHPVIWRVLSYTAQEVKILAPVLLENPPPQKVEMAVVKTDTPPTVPPLPPPRTLFDPSPGSRAGARGPGADNMPVVQALIHEAPAAGGEVVLAANSGPAPLKVTFALSSLGKDSRVVGFFSRKEYPINGQCFEDILEPFAVRIYETRDSRRARGGPVSLGILAVAGRLTANTNRQFYAPSDRRVSLGSYERKESESIWSPVDDQEQILLETGPAPKNMLKNSSFEEYVLPGLPDNWIQTYIMRQFGRNFFGQQTNEVYEGRYSVRLQPDSPGRSWFHPTITYRFWLNRQKGGHWQYDKDYVLSAYIKATGTNAAVRLSLIPDRPNEGYTEQTGTGQVFKVSGEWQRIEWPFCVRKDAGWVAPTENLVVGVRAVPDKGGPPYDVWVDAVQLEAGKQATPYERDSYKAPVVDKKWLSDDVFSELEEQK